MNWILKRNTIHCASQPRLTFRLRMWRRGFLGEWVAFFAFAIIWRRKLKDHSQINSPQTTIERLKPGCMRAALTQNYFVINAALLKISSSIRKQINSGLVGTERRRIADAFHNFLRGRKCEWILESLYIYYFVAYNQNRDSFRRRNVLWRGVYFCGWAGRDVFRKRLIALNFWKYRRVNKHNSLE